jgi:hypothetical protein
LGDGGVNAIRQGRTVALPPEQAAIPGTVRIYAPGLGFLGLGEIEPQGHLVPRRLISAAANRA